MANRYDVLQLTNEMVAINSVNPFRTIELGGKVVGMGNEAQMALYLETILRELGFDVQRQIVQPEIRSEGNGQVDVPARWNVLASRGKAARALLLYGHTDTVDVKPGWETDPFVVTSKTVEGRERLYGLGANDMKSGLAAILCASAKPQLPDTQLKIAFVCDEEFWSFGADVLVNSNFLDNVGLAIAPEIREGQIRPGEQWVGLGRCGRVEYAITLTGRACHGSDALVSRDAVNAADEIGKLSVEIARFCKAEKKVFANGGMDTVNSAFISRIEAGRGMLSLPDSAQLIIDRTFLPNESAPDFEKRLNELVIDCAERGVYDKRATVVVTERSRPTPPCKSYQFAADLPIVAAVTDAVRRTGTHVGYGFGRSVADENRIAARAIPTLVIGPDGMASHTSHEWVDRESIFRLVEVFESICASPDVHRAL